MEIVYRTGMGLCLVLLFVLGLICLDQGYLRRFSLKVHRTFQSLLILGCLLCGTAGPVCFLWLAPAWAGVALLISALGLYRDGGRAEMKRLSAAALLFGALALLEVFTALSYLIYDAAYLQTDLTAAKMFFFSASWAILGIGFYKLIRECMVPPKTPVAIRRYQNVFLIAVAFLEILLVNYAIVEIIQKKALHMQLIMIAIAALLAFDGSFVIFMRRMERSRLLTRQLELARQKQHLEESYYATVEQQYKNSLDMVHRMETYIQNLQHYYEDGGRAEAKRYVRETLQEIAATGMSFGCRNKTLAIILEDKRLLCEKRGIKLSVRDESHGMAFVDVFDITTIFSNLLDNAIEASAKTQEAFVRVKLFEAGETLGIAIENSYAGKRFKIGKRFLSTKVEAGHGIGLKNVAAAVKKYDGTLDLKNDGGVFIARIILPIPVLDSDDR